MYKKTKLKQVVLATPVKYNVRSGSLTYTVCISLLIYTLKTPSLSVTNSNALHASSLVLFFNLMNQVESDTVFLLIQIILN